MAADPELIARALEGVEALLEELAGDLVARLRGDVERARAAGRQARALAAERAAARGP
ncbi:MAG: hypothetical protein H6713_10710 [Myxococcales bacterium]|nr:hypothetical protein [Myxococcales bacterium]